MAFSQFIILSLPTIFSSNACVCVCVFQRFFGYRYPNCVRRMAPTQVPGVVDMMRCWIYHEEHIRKIRRITCHESDSIYNCHTWDKTNRSGGCGQSSEDTSRFMEGTRLVHPKGEALHVPSDHKCWQRKWCANTSFLRFLSCLLRDKFA